MTLVTLLIRSRNGPDAGAASGLEGACPYDISLAGAGSGAPLAYGATGYGPALAPG
jgi:hypothetical protein